MKLSGRRLLAALILLLLLAVVALLIFIAPWRVSLFAAFLALTGGIVLTLLYVRRLILTQNALIKKILTQVKDDGERVQRRTPANNLSGLEKTLYELPERTSAKTAVEIARARKSILVEIAKISDSQEHQPDA